MQRKAFMFLLPMLLMLLLGCSSTPAGNGTDHTEVKSTLVISPVTIVEERETVVTGESTVIEQPGANNTTIENQTIPDYKFEPNKTLFIFFINVSYIRDWTANATNERQGEAILVKKGDADILIDTGPAEMSDQLINFLRNKGVDDIELLVSTHARPENYGGMSALLGNITVEQFMWNGDTGGDAAYAAAVQKAKNMSRKTIESSYLSTISIDGIDFTTMNPKDGANRFASIDNDGIVLKITDRNFCIMATGDVAYGAQTGMANSGLDLSCNVLQIPDYGLGGGTSNIDVFLLKVAPQAAIITGSYFDPAKERYTIEEKLRLKGIQYYETFNTSNKSNPVTNIVRVTTDGYNYSIATQ